MTLSFQHIEHCKKNRNVCKECTEGYQLAKTSTDPKCLDSYYYSEYSKAQNKIQNCTELNADGSTCEICERDYVLSNGKCVYKPECEKKSPCITWRDGKCSTCGDYYFVSNGACTKISIEHCIRTRYDDDNKCEECEEGYYVNAKYECIEFEEGCSRYVNRRCTECKDGYFLNEENDNKCQKIEIENCRSITSLSDTECSFCMNGFIKENGICVVGIPHCRNYEINDNTKCSFCEDGYVPSPDETSCVTLCKESEQLCQVCEDNYYSFDNGKTCEYVKPPKATSTNASWYIRSNLAIISWILLVILA